MAAQEEPFEESRMTLGEHLDELRSRLLRGIVAVFVCFLVSWYFYEDIAEVLWEPHRQAVAMLNEDHLDDVLLEVESGEKLAEEWLEPDTDPPQLLFAQRYQIKLQNTHPSESFVFALMTCLYVAVFLGSPVLLWELWGFIAAGLYRHEQKAVTQYFPLSVALFVGGIAFGYFAMMPYAMYFLGGVFDFVEVENNYKVSEYSSLMFSLCLSLGLVFQLPVLILCLARLGVVEPAMLRRWRGYFVVGSFLLAAILTPPDPVTQSLMAMPMILLYEFGIILARLMGKSRVPPPEAPTSGTPA